MAERRVAQIVRQTGHLNDCTDVARRIAFRQEAAHLHHHADTVADAAADTGHFDTVRQTVVRQIMLGQRMHLRFPSQTAECAGKHHTVVIDVEIRTQRVRTFLRRRRTGGYDFVVFQAETLRTQQTLPIRFCHRKPPNR